jgi:uncharacterized paraquat-inducible protein A
MPAKRSASLRRRYPRRFDIPLLIVVSTVLIGAGLITPAVETELLFWNDKYSILFNLTQMSREGNHAAASIIAICSVAYPVLKIGLLSFFWLFPFPPTWRWRSIQLVRLLGRWGMVDVFALTSIVLASATIGPFKATPKIGLFLYASGILCLGLAGFLMARLARVGR